jgi:signal transduction histidine kinase
MLNFIDLELDHLPLKEIKSRLKGFSEEYLDSAKIQTSSTKLLTYLVNDILDLSQINSGKFRIDSSVFNICEAINEIISIQKQKAELSDVTLNYEI